MRVIDNVKMPGYAQWCANFIRRIFTKKHITLNGEEIDTIEIVYIDSKRIHLLVDDIPFIVRIWDYVPCENDSNGLICAENAKYTLFFAAAEYTFPSGIVSGNGMPVYSSVLRIKWTNDDAIYQREVETYNKLHGA